MTSELFQRRFKNRIGVISKHGVISTENSEPALPIAFILKKVPSKFVCKSNIPQLPKVVAPRYLRHPSSLADPDSKGKLAISRSPSLSTLGCLGMRSNSTLPNLLDTSLDKSKEFNQYMFDDEKADIRRSPVKFAEVGHMTVCADVWRSAAKLRQNRKKIVRPNKS